MATSTQGPNGPTAAADDNSIGTIAWSDVNNVFLLDNVRATASISPGDITHYLVATDFKFTIPESKTIEGVVMTEYVTGGTFGAQEGAHDSAVRIVKGGTIGSSDRSSGTEWGQLGVNAVIPHGGVSDLWDETLDPTDINTTDFGTAIAATTTDTSVTAGIDYISITVYFSPPTSNFFIFFLKKLLPKPLWDFLMVNKQTRTLKLKPIV